MISVLRRMTGYQTGAPGLFPEFHAGLILGRGVILSSSFSSLSFFLLPFFFLSLYPLLL
jgi:hypothetical protein